ncbi:MAG: hypothetical protein DLM65_08340, partial [Candidatus Aeolococcus gillhamiae]
EPHTFSRGAARWGGRLTLEHRLSLVDAQLTLAALASVAAPGARAGAERTIGSCIDIDGGPCVRQAVRIRQQWPALSLANALTRPRHDPVYAQALAGALELRGLR